MKKICLAMFSFLLIFCMQSTTSYAGTWKTMSYSGSGTTIISNNFKSDGDILVDVGVKNIYSGNSGTLEIQRLTTSNTWETVKEYRKDLFVGAKLSTSFSNSIKVARAGGPYRFVFTSDRSVNLSGTVQYFNE
jgi:hypothetical protein